jgi:hypothetical protein
MSPTNGTDFPFDFGLALTPERAQQIPEVDEILDNPPEWLQDWGRQVGAELEDGLRENPSFIAFARENGGVDHTYTVAAPDPFVAPYHSFLLERTLKAQTRGAARLAQGRIPEVNAAGRWLRESPSRSRPARPGVARSLRPDAGSPH